MHLNRDVYFGWIIVIWTGTCGDNYPLSTWCQLAWPSRLVNCLRSSHSLVWWLMLAGTYDLNWGCWSGYHSVVFHMAELPPIVWWLIPGASILRGSWTEAASPSLTQPLEDTQHQFHHFLHQNQLQKCLPFKWRKNSGATFMGGVSGTNLHTCFKSTHSAAANNRAVCI